MLTRLRVKGFKNLVDVDVRFGPLTCIAGPNAVGKSNLFDAIRFLSATAGGTLMEAALAVRNEQVRKADARAIFHRMGETIGEHMEFEAEMIVPKEAVDDLGQTARASANFLRYSLDLRYRETPEATGSGRGPIEILNERLVHIPSRQASKHLRFAHDAARWRKEAIRSGNRQAPFISTGKEETGQRVIYLHQDGGGRGKAKSNPATQPRTVLSAVNAAESPTVLCARREMESWRLLQLEPTALREPDPINAPAHLAPNGAHLPATLYRLAQASRTHDRPDPQRIYCQVANRLHDLIDEVKEVRVDRNEKWDSLTLEVASRDGAFCPARSLSDGTLRFLALSVLNLDPQAWGVICLEEPENGIHPDRISEMLRLLHDIANDPQEPVDDTNPLRQVIVNTHSPLVVLEVPEDSLLVAKSSSFVHDGTRGSQVQFAPMGNTWRHRADPETPTATIREVISYLNRSDDLTDFYAREGRRTVQGERRGRGRVVDREDLQPYLPRVTG